ncbi:MAG TPA: FtsH protease activity modulator HflK [Sphingomicrobium sp.]|nr:FtsH protease activity modulator HflK [Sphingomicrobium sp.]
MSILLGWGSRVRGLFADNKGPWGSSSGDDSSTPPQGDGNRPWGEQPQRPRRASLGGGNVTSLDELLRRGRARFGGGGGGGIGGIPGRPDRSLIVWLILGLVAIAVVFTSFHLISPGQRGVVTRFGRYHTTLSPGVSLTFPAPIDRVRKLDVENIRTEDLGSTGSETLMLTGDQNIIDIAYSVRWNIRDPELYLFKIAQPEVTIREVAESAMRAVIATVSLGDAIGEGRGEIEARVQETMQRILDGYRAGVTIQGVAIKQADPPQAVNEAFKEVNAAQQRAQSYINQANAYSLQLRQRAQGDAAAFDKVYEQYRLAPDVTRRRMYYETMERVLQNVDKTIVEAPGVTSYLPLTELNKRARPEPGQ